MTKFGAFAGMILLSAVTAASADVTISTDATVNMLCSGGVCSPTATDAVLNVNDLESLLASGNVEVTTTGSGVQANNIDVTAPLSWSTSNALTLDAYESLTVDGSIAVVGLSGFAIITNDGGSNGVLSFGNGGNVTFANLSSILTINGSVYTLVDTVKTLASAVTADPSGTFAFANAYNAKADRGYDMAPITYFYGTFEGLGNTISNLNIRSGYCASLGLFDSIESGGTVRDLTLLNSSISGNCPESNMGILAAGNGGSIFGCHSTGYVHLHPEIRANYADLGGLVGNNEGTITFSSSSASVKVARYGGGLVGANSGTIEQSFATGDVDGFNVGGLAGYSDGAIDVAYATGEVTAKHGPAGALVGWVPAGGSISNAYATGAVAVGMAGDVGGLIGWNESSLTSSYSTGAPAGSYLATKGGSVGDNEGTATDLYWDTKTSGTGTGVGKGNKSGVTGLTSRKLKSGLPAGFDPSVWNQQKGINHGFPYLIAIPPK